MTQHNVTGTGNSGRRDQRQEGRRTGTRQRTMVRRRWIVGAIAVVLALGAGGGYYVFAQRDSAPVPGTAIDGIACGAMEGRAEHIHSHLALYWNGKPVIVSALVGIPVNQDIANTYCFYWLHTHATSGVVHVEAPASGTYTLGQFFDIWRDTAQWDRQSTVGGAPRLDDAFLNALRAAPSANVRVYLGSKAANVRYGDVTLADHKDITIEFGTPLRPPVATFDWAHWNGA